MGSALLNHLACSFKGQSATAVDSWGRENSFTPQERIHKKQYLHENELISL